MKILTLLSTAVLAAGALAVQDAPTPAEASPQHEWLQQLVGEWHVSSEMVMEPGAEPTHMESTESVRALGEFWVISEGSADFGGMPYQSVLTVGWDPGQEVFVGTWIDTMQPHMWTYRGTLDEEQRALSLETEGPDMIGGDPSQSRKYVDRFEVTGPDSKVLTSSYLGDDGEWVQMMRAEYTRVEADGGK